MHTLATAAAAVGRNKTAIMRAINSGKIPVSRVDDSEIPIDLANLHRIYPPLQTNGNQHPVYQLHSLLIPLAKWNSSCAERLISARDCIWHLFNKPEHLRPIFK
jgi:hypothetical protein